MRGRRAFLALLLGLIGAMPARAAGGALERWAGGATPPLALKSLAGADVDLARLRGKVVLVNFWATWCEPCRDEMPAMDKLRERFADEPFVMLAVNVDEPEQRIRRFLERLPVRFDVLLDPGLRATKAWGARILPSTYLVDRNGRIRFAARGELDWADEQNVSALRALLRER
jgi:peroxiredoxin